MDRQYGTDEHIELDTDRDAFNVLLTYQYLSTEMSTQLFDPNISNSSTFVISYMPTDWSDV